MYRTSKSFQTLHYYIPETFTDLLIAVAENVRRIISDLNQSILVLLQIDKYNLHISNFKAFLIVSIVFITIEKRLFSMFILKKSLMRYLVVPNEYL